MPASLHLIRSSESVFVLPGLVATETDTRFGNFQSNDIVSQVDVMVAHDSGLAALLGADLDNDAGLPHSVAGAVKIRHPDTHGFLDIRMLASTGGGLQMHSMDMIRRRDHAGVQIPQGQQLLARVATDGEAARKLSDSTTEAPATVLRKLRRVVNGALFIMRGMN